MNWKEDYKRKLVSAEEAVKVVKSGDRVIFPMAQQPNVLAEALAARKDVLRNVEILQGVTTTAYPWLEPGYEEAFIVNCGQYTGPRPRPMMHARKADFTPVTYAMEFKDLNERRPGCIDPDVVVVVVTPPNENGYCSFGEAVWEKKEYIQRSKIALAEVNEHLIRTYGNNFVHVSEIDYFVEA
ncbi:MAG: 4-hydroxybutyrate CoA-transferase, partial [Thermodesulfobacteriota bacterium]|nr:4-hydroxybutyrate CoA-transferase [Thermodesulfobacteriota bacterium]